jgi:hypothetical protein
MAQIVDISFPAVPSFPNGGMSYEQRYQNELNNILRLYLERLTAQLQTLSRNTDGAYLEFPFIEASDSTTQYATATNTPTIVKWNTTALNNGFTLNVGNTATALVAGIYKITYSLQFANNDNAIHDAVVWLRINGSTSAADVPSSTTTFTLQARKSALLPNFVCGYSEVVFTLNAGDTVGLWWGTDLAATSGGATGVYMYSLVAQTTPMAYPATPSSLGSITFVSAIPT